MTNTQPKPLIVLRDISRVFGTGQDSHFALHKANLTVFEGDFIAIVGASGSGKSTLLNIIGLLDHPTSGDYSLLGHQTVGIKERQRNELRSRFFGFVFQSSHVLPRETVARNAALGLRIQGRARRERLELVTNWLQVMGLQHRANTFGREVSGGERQRLALARALATSPTVLLADEPTGNLDQSNTSNVVEYLRKLNAAGTTIIMITHDEEVARAATRRIQIKDGVVEDETSVPLRRMPDSRRSSGSFRSGDTSVMREAIDGLSDALSSLTSSLTRTMLLMLAFSLGIAGLIAATGVSQSASIQVAERVSQAALDEVRVQFDPPAGEEEESWVEKSQKQIAALKGVQRVGIRAAIPAQDALLSRFNADSPAFIEDTNIGVVAVDKQLLGLNDALIRPASAAALFDVRQQHKVALVGTAAAERLGLTNKVDGNFIWVLGQRIPVVGIIEASPRDPSLETSVLVSLNLVDLDSSEVVFVARTDDGYPAPLSDAIPLAISPDNVGAVKVSTVADLRQLGRGIQADFAMLIIGISVILLLLAVLSASTSMYLSVRSRSGEIALKRAIGASRWSVFRHFLLEGAIVGSAGGLAGAAVGTFVVVVVCAIQRWTPVLDPLLVSTAVVIGLVTGLVSAAYPALIASREDPAQAIRG